MRRLATAVLATALLASCAAKSSPPAAPRDAGANAPAPAVRFPSGAEVDVELAILPEERAQGLMYRESLAPGHGMLFFFDEESSQSFWMKNCHFPIDIVWIDRDRRFVSASYHTLPCAADPCPTYPPAGPALFVVEVADGVARKENLKKGDRIEFLRLPAERLPAAAKAALAPAIPGAGAR